MPWWTCTPSAQGNAWCLSHLHAEIFEHTHRWVASWEIFPAESHSSLLYVSRAAVGSIAGVVHLGQLHVGLLLRFIDQGFARLWAVLLATGVAWLWRSQ